VPPPANLGERLLALRERIALAATSAGRSPGEVQLLAVTKGQPVEVVREAVAHGLGELGENYLQECSEKAAQLGPAEGVRWHLIGHLQRNKARRAAQLFQMVESVDSVALARLLADAVSSPGPPLPVLLEVELTGLPTRSGLREGELLSVAEAVARLPALRLRGLMTVASQELPGREFSRCRELRDRIQVELGAELPVLSMGMSSDFEAAIQEGSTEVRIGTLLLGPRPQPPLRSVG
jgi:pyridoxal phosphate enzyme (YggS family)